VADTSIFIHRTQRQKQDVLLQQPMFHFHAAAIKAGVAER